MSFVALVRKKRTSIVRLLFSNLKLLLEAVNYIFATVDVSNSAHI